jgi:hypothetical protein
MEAFNDGRRFVLTAPRYRKAFGFSQPWVRALAGKDSAVSR